MDFTASLSYSIDGRQFSEKFLFVDREWKNPHLRLAMQSVGGAHGRVLKVNLFSDEKLESIVFQLQHPLKLNRNSRVFLNGFQSWTDTKEFTFRDKMQQPPPKLLSPLMKKYEFPQYGDYTFYKYSEKRGELHGHSLAYRRVGEQEIDFLGSLNEATGYTIMHYSFKNQKVSIVKDLEGLQFDRTYELMHLYVAQGDENLIFDKYFQLQQIKPTKTGSTTGWTSWYNYYEQISERIINENIENYVVRKIPIDVFQIDDGYQNAVGDWLEFNDRFPNGLGTITQKIHQNAMKAGLWLAPFAAEKKSNLVKNHPDWILRNADGQPVIGGSNWSGFYALDLYNEQFRDYLRTVFRTVLEDWHFDLVKLDFLYVVTLIPQHGKTRGQVMTEAMAFLREIIGNKLIIGCGVPLAPAFGRVDFCRIGCDLDLEWNRWLFRITRHRERVSTINTLLDSISRRLLNQRAFINDPDVFLLRNDNIKLTEDQKYTVFCINQIFGDLLFTSDNIAEYNNRQLALYLSQFPVLPKKIGKVLIIKDLVQAAFQIDGQNYLLLSNLGCHSVEFEVKDGDFFYTKDARDFYLHKNYTLRIAPYNSFILRRIPTNKYAVAGCTLQLFPAGGIKISTKDSQISLIVDKKILNSGHIFVKTPPGSKNVLVNGKEYQTQLQDSFAVAKVEYNAV